MTPSYQSAKRNGLRFIMTATALALLVQSGMAGTTGVAAAASTQTEAKVTTNSSKAIYTTFQSKLKQKNGLIAADAYLTNRITQVTSHHLTLMVLQLENARLKSLTTMTDRMLVPNVQDKMMKIYQWNDTFTSLMKRTQDTSLQSLLKEARDSGYKLVMIEGSLYPIMNYSAFQKYNANVKPDISSYINIMAAETKKIPAEDGGLLIGYQEVLLRARNQELFLELYPTSNRVKQVQNLLDSYTMYTFYGLNNTPLFDYETNKMVPNAQKGYTAVIQRLATTDSPFLDKLASFMDVVREAKYEKTTAVEAWLDINVPLPNDSSH
ncbi:hypothetical protein [Paenibacillus xylanexedens]|uniref:hypothetical protein n=1 Tax=Paenibacillus xylanexedens TaxID=528191 RepID=UPI00119D54DE|nr:hypothetical protein [Paenibacillus xylanexedens]